MLLRRKEVERSSSSSPWGREVRWSNRSLCSEGLCLCFICWQCKQLSALCQQRESTDKRRLRQGTTTAALLQEDARQCVHK